MAGGHGNPKDTETTSSNPNYEGSETSTESPDYSEFDWSENYESEVPEGAMATSWAGWLAYAAAVPLNKRERVLDAFKHVNGEHFEHELLKVRDGATFQRLKLDFAISETEIAKQKKKESKKPEEKRRKFAQVGILPVKKYRERMDFDSFDHKRQAIQIANAVHTRINAFEIKGKLEATAQVYGLNDGSKVEMMRGLAKWQKENPGKHIDEYLHSTGQSLSYKQQPSTESKRERKKKGREKTEELNKRLDAVRMETVKANREQIIAAQREVKDLLDPSKPLVSQDELKRRIDRTLHPPTTTTQAPFYTPATTTSFAGYESGFTPTHTTTSTTISPITPKILHPPPSPISPAATQLATPIKRLESSFLKNFGGKFLGGKLAGFSTGSLISKGLTFAAGKLGLSAALGALSGGTSLLLQAGLEAAKRLPVIGDLVKSLESVAFDTAKIALVAVAAVAVLFFVALSPQSRDVMQQFSLTPEKMETAGISQDKNLSLTREEFEKNILGIQSKKVTTDWNEFENLILNQNKESLTIEDGGFKTGP